MSDSDPATERRHVPKGKRLRSSRAAATVSYVLTDPPPELQRL